MKPQEVQRRLTTILCADVAGYSRLMGVDEEDTLARFDACRQKIEVCVTQHGGRVFGAAGDSFMAEFPSAVEAVRCAVAMQRELEVGNAELPEERRMRFRMGINLGDVMVQDENLFGDGVNVAARVEALATPGGVCISSSIHDHVRRKLDLDFEDMGERSVKNISEPIRIFRIRLDGEAPPDAAEPLPSTTNDRPSVAVLPFNNMSPDPEQEYFSDGITEDIITELARFRSLFVIARNSTFTFKGSAVDVAEIGRRLNVRYVLEGSVRKVGSRIRVTAQLIEVEGGSHIWADRYDADLEDIFTVQDKITRSIVSMIAGHIESDSARRARNKPTENMAAYDHLLQGMQHFNRFTREENAEAQRLFRTAIELDPQFALAHAYLSTTYLHDWFWEESEADMDLLAYDIARKAVGLDNRESRCHLALGRVLLHRRQFGQAIVHHQRCVELNPNDADAAAKMGLLLAFTGQPDEGVEWLMSAHSLNPYHPDWYCEDLGQGLFVGQLYEESIRAFEQVAAPPLWAKVWLVAAYGHLERMDKAEPMVAGMMREAPDLDWEVFARKEPFQHEEDMDHLLEGMRLAGLPMGG